jgi:GTPase SAR1 family protein
MDPHATAAAIKILKAVHASGVFKRVASRLQRPYKFGVFGSSGTGKSNLLQSIQSKLAPAISRKERTLVNHRFDLLIYGKRFLFIDTPGQELYRDERDRAVAELKRKAWFRRRRFTGVINVVSYGYHEGPQQDLSSVFGKDQRVREEYLNQRRKYELEQLAEWVQEVARHNSSACIITVVSKADLWWQRRDEVIKYYETGKYAEVLKHLGRVKHWVLRYCAVLHKFYGVQPLPGLLDDDGKREIQAQFIRSLLEITGIKLKV